MKKKNSGWIAMAAVFAGILLFAYFNVKTGSDFQVVYHQEHDRGSGWEKAVAEITVFPSSELKFSEVPLFWDIGGWLWLALMVGGCWFVWTDRYLSKKKITDYDRAHGAKKGEWKKVAFIFGPIILCAIFWFAGYSARLTLGAYNNTFENFKSEFKVSDELASKIQKEGGTGTLHIKDENGLLKAYFLANKK